MSFLVDTDSEDDLPAEWNDGGTDDRKNLCTDDTSNTSQQTHPNSRSFKKLSETLPFGWTRKICEETGKELFHNAREDRTSNVDPRLAFPIVDLPSGSERVRFDSTSTASQVLQGRDLTGLQVIVTGGNSGIGFQTARALANAGACVVLACRSWERGRQAVEKILEENRDAHVQLMLLDLCELASVRRFAEVYKKEHQRLDRLVVNAGVFWKSFQTTADGYETTFQVNYLAHRYLIRLLSPLLLSSAPARIVFLVPESHRFTDLSEETICRSLLTPTTACKHHPLMAHNLSKMALALLATTLHHRWYRQGVRSIMVHPGNVVWSGLHRSPWWLRCIGTCCSFFAKSAEQAAAVVVYAAVARQMEGRSGVYLNNFLEVPPSDVASDFQLALQLSIISNQLISSALSLQPSSHPSMQSSSHLSMQPSSHPSVHQDIFLGDEI